MQEDNFIRAEMVKVMQGEQRVHIGVAGRRDLRHGEKSRHNVWQSGGLVQRGRVQSKIGAIESREN